MSDGRTLSRGAGTATISDVAALAAVSIKTVSRVLNDEPNVRPEKRERVLAAVEELSYRPSSTARGLAAGRSYLIGLFYQNPNVYYITGLLHGALTRGSRLGYHLVVEECEAGNADSEARVTTLARQARLDGVILTPPISDCGAILSGLETAGVPVVRIAPWSDPGRTPHVWMDDRSAAAGLTRHLIGQGHRRIAFIQGPPDHGASHWRFGGFSEAMAEAGIPIDPALVQPGDFTYACAIGSAEALLSREAPPTAVFACNDEMAAAVIAVAHRRGVRVPGELSVVGFDDTPMASRIWPQLTTVTQPIAEMAASAVDLLVEQCARSPMAAPASLRLDFRMVIRDSTSEGPSCHR